MKESLRRMGKRLLSLLLSFSAAAGSLPSVTSQQAETVLAANSQGKEAKNIVEVLGMDTSLLSSVNADDTSSNPLGKKRNRVGGSDEVMIASSYGGSTSFLIGQNTPVGQTYSANSGTDKQQFMFSIKSDYYTDDGKEASDLTYISEIAISAWATKKGAKNDLEDAGFTVVDWDVNEGGSQAIYLGYKTTHDVTQAITDIKLKVGNDYDDTWDTDGRHYQLATYIGLDNDAGFRGKKGDTNYLRATGIPTVHIYTTKDTIPNLATEERNAVTSFTVNDTKDGAIDTQSLNQDGKDNNIDHTKDRFIHITQKNVVKVNAEGSDKVPLPAGYGEIPQISRTAPGFFDPNESGQQTQYAMAKYDYASRKMYLGIYDAAKPDVKPTELELGWFDPSTDGLKKDTYDFTQNLYWAMAGIQIAAGDFNNDGIDEIAVYNPKTALDDNAEEKTYLGAVEVYSRVNINTTDCMNFVTGNDDKTKNSWTKLTSYYLPLGSLPSVTVGDVNNDGYDDLLVSNDGVTEIGMGGSKPLDRTYKLESDYTYDREPNKNQTFPLLSPTAVVYNKPVSTGNNHTVSPYVAVLGFVLEHTPENYNPLTDRVNGHYVLKLYQFDSLNSKFIPKAEKLFENQSVTYEREHLEYNNLMINVPSDLHCMNGRLFSRWLAETENVAEMDFSIKDNELKITTAAIPDGQRLLTRKITTMLNQYQLSGYCYDYQTAVLTSNCAADKVNIDSPAVETTFYQYVNTDAHEGFFGVGAYTAGDLSGITDKKPMMSPYMASSSYPYMYAIVDTDNDSCNVTFTGEHWVQYSDPEIRAVLSAAPYFKDLAAVDPDYGKASTSYGNTQSESSGVTEAFSMEFGGYLKFAQKFKIFGVELFGLEEEIHSLSTFAQGYSSVDTTSFDINYTTVGVDSVVFYSVPIECYKYYYTVNKIDPINGDKNYESIPAEMSVPRQPSHTIKTMAEYRELCKHYKGIPKLPDDILEHTVGEPSTYPKTAAKYTNPTEHKQLLNIDANTSEGQSSFGESISFSTDTSYDYSGGMRLSWLAGITSEVGGAGLEGGSSIQAGTVTTSSKTDTCSCELDKLPAGYGKDYSMSTKLFVHEGSYINEAGDVVKFPVVDYLVPECFEPPHMPSDFKQDYLNSDTNSIALTWDYEPNAAISGFTVYRVPEMVGMDPEPIEIGSVSYSGGELNEKGRYEFTFTDKGTDLEGGFMDLLPNSAYTYQITANRGTVRRGSDVSIKSPKLIAYTHSESQHPTVKLEGVYNNAIQMYPDISHDVTVSVEFKDGAHPSPSYRWQKRNAKTGKWDNLEYTTNTLPLKELIDAEKHMFDAVGDYRCMVTLQLASNEKAVALYSDSFTMTEKLRAAKAQTLTASAKDHMLNGTVTVIPDDEQASSNSKTFHTPHGTVVFKLYHNGELVLTRSSELKDVTGTRSSEASFAESTQEEVIKEIIESGTARKETVMQEKYSGIYQLVACYSGDKTFGSFETEPVSVLFGSDGIYPVTYRITETTDADTGKAVENKEMTDAFYYNDTMQVEFHQLQNDENGILTDSVVESIPFIRTTVKDMPSDKAYTGTQSLGEYASEEKTEIEYSYYVKPIPLTIGVSIPELYLGEITESNSPKPVLLKGETLTKDDSTDKDTAEELASVSYIIGNVSTTSITQSATYKTDLKKTDTARSQLYAITFVNQSFHVGGYRLNLDITKPENGRINIIVPTNPTVTESDSNVNVKVNTEHTVRLFVTPDTGYRVKKWTVTGADLSEYTEDTAETIQFTVDQYDISVSVELEKYNGTISVDETHILSGKVIYPEGFVSGGSYGVSTMLTFDTEGNDDCDFDFWEVIFSDGRDSQRIRAEAISVQVTGAPIQLFPVFIGKPCNFTYPQSELTAECLYINRYDDWLNPIIPDGTAFPKGSKIRITPVNAQISQDNPWVLNGQPIDFSKGYYDFVIDGDTVIQRQSEFITTTSTTESTTTSGSTTESTTTFASTSESTSTSTSTSKSATTSTSTSKSTTTSTSTSKSTTTSASTSKSTTTSTSTSKSTTTSTSTSKSATTSTSTSESTTTSASTSKSTTTSTSTSESTTISTSKSITTSTSRTESATTSASVSTGISSSVSETSPTVSTSGTTVSAEITTSAVQTETTTSTESASSTTETTSAVPERIPGDVNGDGIVNLKDVTLIRRSIAGGWNVTIDESAADVNGDHAVNLKDVTLIRRYIAGGWNVTLK